MSYYFKKGKNATEMQKSFVQFMENVLWVIKRVKSGLQSSVLEISQWTRLHHQVDQLEVDSSQIKTLTESNQHYTMWETADILKISRSSVENLLHQFGYVNHFDVWVPHKLSEKKKPSWLY